MRVIGGKAKGRRLQTVPGRDVRPITDRVKESLFNIIGADIQDATFWDLFGGTGSVGIEALSRGAAFARFVERNPSAIRTIRANLAATGLGARAEVIKGDAFTMLVGPVDRQFDYIYIAPPQYKNLWERALRMLDERPAWLSTDAWVIVQIHPVEYQALELGILTEFDRRKYGSTMLVFYRRQDASLEDEPA